VVLGHGGEAVSQGEPTRFVHIFIFRDAEAGRIHSESAAVKKFSSILYPECLAPAEFIDYRYVISNAGDESRKSKANPACGAGVERQESKADSRDSTLGNG